jgi:hypothetical protein
VPNAIGNDGCGPPPDLESRHFRKIQMIDDATSDQDLRVPPSNHLEKLRGDLARFHVNELCNNRRNVTAATARASHAACNHVSFLSQGVHQNAENRIRWTFKKKPDRLKLFGDTILPSAAPCPTRSV